MPRDYPWGTVGEELTESGLPNLYQLCELQVDQLIVALTTHLAPSVTPDCVSLVSLNQRLPCLTGYIYINMFFLKKNKIVQFIFNSEKTFILLSFFFFCSKTPGGDKF